MGINTHVTTVESIVKMTFDWEKLILPSHLSCCLCQFKNNVETFSQTVKLHCEAECLTNTHHNEELFIEGFFVKILEGWK